MGQKEIPGWLVFGHYGGKNTGDEAMLLGLVDQYLIVGQYPLSIVYQGDVPPSLRQEGVEFIQPKTWPVLMSTIRCHGIVIGGGTHFQDDYRGARALRHYRYMLRFIAVSFLAKLFKKRVIWLSMGFGPFLRAPGRWMTRLGLKFSDYVTVRDSQSMREIISWIPPQKIQKSFDLAALLVNTTFLDNPKKAEDYRQDLTLGISVTPGSKSKTRSHGSEMDFWDHLLDALQAVYQENPQLKIKVITIRGGERESDVELSDKLYRHLARTDANRVKLIPYQPDPCDTLKEIYTCDAFIATRFHSEVLAYLSQCHLLILAYHRKLLDLASEIGLPEQACVSIDGTYSKENLKEKIIDLLAGSDQNKATLPVEKAIEMAYQNITVLKRFESS